MNKTNAIKLAVVSAVMVGLAACSKDKNKPRAVAPSPVAKAEVGQCPQGIEGTWQVGKNEDTKVIISKVDGVLSIDGGNYQESVLVNGLPQQLHHKDKAFENVVPTVTAVCGNENVVISEKDKDGNVKTSEFNINAEGGNGTLTITEGKQVWVHAMSRLAPAEQAPVEQAPAQQAPAEQAPIEQAPVEESK